MGTHTSTPISSPGGMSLDPNVGDFEQADMLIEGAKIVAVQPNLKASATVIDATKARRRVTSARRAGQPAPPGAAWLPVARA